MGAYGLLIILSSIQIIYADSTSFGQRNLKKRIAYSSVSYMGFIILGIGSISDNGLNEAVLQIISHRFIGATLFFLGGTNYDKLHLLYLDEMGGMTIPIDFVAELIVFFGVITSQKYLFMMKILS
ncbi:NADH-ubiquinone/plastoquinone (complex I) protein [Medicago truncatula]|uniref:NADH-ubiquinone/plastoquinone (Complex I) protein n=1 Tax=Medicago truncatula TaxID=3880 RepID=G7ZWB5_MEDTR|nr:NADH-ubiquinone/plastoquinone (complex I) protein [Medicago truncatula]